MAEKRGAISERRIERGQCRRRRQSPFIKSETTFAQEPPMNHLLRAAACTAALALTAPAFAQSSEDLNRQELSRLSMAAPTQPAAAPATAVPAAPQAAYPQAA